ncbi:MAG: sigma factor, partial [Gammaproteobacteria bacterium]
MTDADLPAIQASLLRRCALGDAAALRTLYDGCAPQLYAVVLRILSRPDLAEDALQDAFIQIWRNAGSYRPGKGQPMTWMYGIARYRALDS